MKTLKLESHETRQGKDFKNILKYCITDGWQDDEDRLLIQTPGLEGIIITSVRTVLSECKVWKCDSLQDKQSKVEPNKNQIRPKQRGIQQKTICIIVCSFFCILSMP